MLVALPFAHRNFPKPHIRETLAREFNMVEPEDAMKWWVDPAGCSRFDFRARRRGGSLRAGSRHEGPRPLPGVGSQQSRLAGARAFHADALSQLLQEHITTVMKHYAGQVFAWDVVNEASG